MSLVAFLDLADVVDVPSSIVYTPKEWNETIMGKSLAKHPLINYKCVRNGPPVPFPDGYRPLAGIKIIELARIIALPSAGIVLTSLGAEVIRVQSKDMPDFSPAELCLMQGKKAVHLDLNQEIDRAQLRKLIEDADVVMQGYRPEVFTKRGFGLDYALEVAERRGRGIIYMVSCGCHHLEYADLF